MTSAAEEGAPTMAISDQEITSRFPVGYHHLHPNVSLNFQLNVLRLTSPRGAA